MHVGLFILLFVIIIFLAAGIFELVKIRRAVESWTQRAGGDANRGAGKP